MRTERMLGKQSAHCGYRLVGVCLSTVCVAQSEADTKAPLLDLLCQNQNQCVCANEEFDSKLTTTFTQIHMDN